jgi:hypothetical protein
MTKGTKGKNSKLLFTIFTFFVSEEGPREYYSSHIYNYVHLLARTWWAQSPHITPLPVTKFTKNRPEIYRGNVPDGHT